LTNYESYYRTDFNKTKGFFQNDPERTAIVKHPGQMQVENYRDLMKVNPQIKAYLEKQMAQEDKKLMTVKQGRIILDHEMNRVKQRTEK
jgi:hypothetical protein